MYNQINTNQLLRFTTAGSVDDGKSTLIGRLLYDSKSLFEDQIEAIQQTTKRKGLQGIDLALFTDGLRDEREQGITIDVAYRYFTTEKRKFIIADTPGHIQYTRNMITGASTADAAIILIDARNGIVEQTRRHTYIAHLLRLKHVIVCVNKMDLVEYSESVFNSISADFRAFASSLSIKKMHLVPISALNGDNVVNRSQSMTWYSGKSLLSLLETIDLSENQVNSSFRFPVQTVLRPQTEEFHDFRAYAGRIDAGVIHPGSEITVFPSGQKTRVKTIEFNGQQLEEATVPMSVAITIEDDLDISRGNMLTGNHLPLSSQQLSVMLCWLGNQPARPNAKYVLKHTTNEVIAVIKQVVYQLNINDFSESNEVDTMKMNEIYKVELKTNNPLFYDPYTSNKTIGSLVLIDPATNETVAAGMILEHEIDI